MIINEFPPVGESGVQRPLKFLKYLALSGWQPYIVTPKKLPKSVIDPSLASEIPQQAIICKTSSWGIPARGVDLVADLREKATRPHPIKKAFWIIIKFINDLVFPLDKQIGWVPFAFWTSAKLIKKHRIKNIYITGYPFSAFLVGILLKMIMRKQIFWVADYRDAWQFEPLFESNVLPFRKAIIRFWDDLVLKNCDRVVFVTDFIKQRYVSKHAFLNDKSVVITNGYDESDFAFINPSTYSSVAFVYMGMIYSFKRSPMTLLKAISELNLQNFKYLHFGTIPPAILEEIKARGYDFYHFMGYKPHQEALNHAAGADINILINDDDEESVGVLTGKIFELIRLGRPILALGAKESLIKDLIITHKLGEYAPLRDIETIKTSIIKLLQSPQELTIKPDVIARFSREALTQSLITLYPKASK